MRLLLPLVAVMTFAAPLVAAPKLELVGDVAKIWEGGKHNAFTDLIRFKFTCRGGW